jgi:hypothetical protein
MKYFVRNASMCLRRLIYEEVPTLSIDDGRNYRGVVSNVILGLARSTKIALLPQTRACRRILLTCALFCTMFAAVAIVADRVGSGAVRAAAMSYRSLSIPVICVTNPVVTSTADSGDGSLRQAIIDACDASSITFNLAGPAPYAINLTTAELLINKNLAIHGPGSDNLIVQRSATAPEFTIFHIANGNYNVTFEGLTVSHGRFLVAGGISNESAGTIEINNTTVSGNSATCLCDGGGGGGGILNFRGGTVNINNSTFSGNSSALFGGGISNGLGTMNITHSTVSGNSANQGGGILNGTGRMAITDSTVSGNFANATLFQSGLGAGILNSGTLTIGKSEISGNLVQGGAPFSFSAGGGIYNGGYTTLTKSVVRNNSASQAGGAGIFNDVQSTLVVANSTLNNNSADGMGGGIGTSGLTFVTSSTISGNFAGGGGGIGGIGYCDVWIKSSTITDNTASAGGGLSGAAVYHLGNTIVGNNHGQLPDIYAGAGPVESLDYNLIQQLPSPDGEWTGYIIVGPTSHNIYGVSANLGPLADNGGPTKTHAPLEGSPVIDKGKNMLTVNTDQREFPRPVDLDDSTYPNAEGGDSTDIGAFEVQGPHMVTAGSSLINESCPPANGMIDPGETVTVNLNLINNGRTSTGNLVATLLSNSNVLAPSSPQTYGAVEVGNTIGRDFSFTANGNCGDQITLTLQLQDISNNLGTVTYSFVLGCNTACQGAPRISTSTALSCDGVNTHATIIISNSGTATANNVMLTTAKLGGISGTSLPQTIATLAPGASATATVKFSGAPRGSTTLQIGGTYTGGSFNSNRRVTAPACGP